MSSAFARGRRRVLDQKKKEELCMLVARGASVEEAADDLDVSLRTVQREAKLDEDFDHGLKVAQRCAPDPEKIMQSAARAHWRAAAWLLERSDPEKYAKRSPNSCSPRKFQEALELVLEAALEITAPEQRQAAFEHVQAAADEAFDRVFPNCGPWGRAKFAPLSKAPRPLLRVQQKRDFSEKWQQNPILDRDSSLDMKEPDKKLLQPSNGMVTSAAYDGETCTDAVGRAATQLQESSGALPLEGRAGEGVEAGTRLPHPSLTLPIKGRGPERSDSAPLDPVAAFAKDAPSPDDAARPFTSGATHRLAPYLHGYVGTDEQPDGILSPKMSAATELTEFPPPPISSEAQEGAVVINGAHNGCHVANRLGLSP